MPHNPILLTGTGYTVLPTGIPVLHLFTSPFNSPTHFGNPFHAISCGIAVGMCLVFQSPLAIDEIGLLRNSGVRYWLMIGEL